MTPSIPPLFEKRPATNAKSAAPAPAQGEVASTVKDFSTVIDQAVGKQSHLDPSAASTLPPAEENKKRLIPSLGDPQVPIAVVRAGHLISASNTPAAAMMEAAAASEEVSPAAEEGEADVKEELAEKETDETEETGTLSGFTQEVSSQVCLLALPLPVRAPEAPPPAVSGGEGTPDLKVVTPSGEKPLDGPVPITANAEVTEGVAGRPASLLLASSRPSDSDSPTDDAALAPSESESDSAATVAGPADDSVTQPQMPTPPAAPAGIARGSQPWGPNLTRLTNSGEPRGTAKDGGSMKVAIDPSAIEATRGTPVAKHLERMGTSSFSEERVAFKGSPPDQRVEGGAPAESFSGTNHAASLPEATGEKDPSAETKAAMEWLGGRQVNTVDRAAPDSLRAPIHDPGAKVDQLSQLLTRESALVRQHNSDSMAVILRPDANTELFVHLTKNNGQVEVMVRCERGDFQQLNQLWTQLQESLAPQKVRLSPLQESNIDLSRTPFSPAGESGSNGSGQSPQRQPEPDEESLAEWPPSASPKTKAVSPRRGSGQRLTTSRPGWETWA